MSKAEVEFPIVICSYCLDHAVLLEDVELYGKSYGGKLFWVCRPCDAWVGTHASSPTHKPLGRLANAELRALKVQAHALFDPLWQAAARLRGISKGRARRQAYRWLADSMGLSMNDCHIGMFDEDQVRQAIEICKARERVKVENLDVYVAVRADADEVVTLEEYRRDWRYDKVEILWRGQASDREAVWAAIEGRKEPTDAR